MFINMPVAQHLLPYFAPISFGNTVHVDTNDINSGYENMVLKNTLKIVEEEMTGWEIVPPCVQACLA